MIAPIGKYTINFDYLAYAIDDEELETVVLTMARKTRSGQSQIVLAGADRDTFFEIVRHEYNRRVSVGKS